MTVRRARKAFRWKDVSARCARARLRGQAIRTLTSPTPVNIHSVFDSQDRRIAEYNQASRVLICKSVCNGWGEADQETLQWSVFPPNPRAHLRGPGAP